ncbi:MAG TPA: TerB family tellurite resistance protein [Thermoanaerobaculia bacterium]
MGLQKLTAFLRNALTTPAEQTPEDHRNALQVATAAVLLEVAYADQAISREEEEKLVHHLVQQFELSKEVAHELLEAADEIREETIDHFALTHTIRKNTSLEERIDIVKTMWRLVYSDNELHQYENYIVRKLADLLGLEHRVMIDAKLAVKAEASNPR